MSVRSDVAECENRSHFRNSRQKHRQIQHVMSLAQVSILAYPWNISGIAPWRESGTGRKENP
ncbi:hypothetical protein DV515_00006641 [Chloebia gouldiae]|uniref:Uncharacterized protein n=1 Tax=Chloebia gouldiae TaxID=44316 RepID=A0A3L8SJY6_CHLGU|nr:hypothetical protein DV515_00006641 [Chloebia gouldiae]